MAKAKKHGFLLGFLLNIVLNLEWSIPAWILLGLHCWTGISIWWFYGALILWIVPTLIFSLLMGCAMTISDEEPPNPTVKVKLRENEKNPFEKKTETIAN